ncbi:ribbon-helix-helix protein, CopG family [Nostoc sp. B(2019)]|nr:ribbon-helix-helix protein, CopG family [Nostoc sp. B(2019)]
MARTSITVPEQLLEEFKQYCDKQRRSVSAQIALLMEEALKQLQKESE